MPTSEVNNLKKMAQVSSFQVQSQGAGNIPDFEYKDASIVVKYNGYILKIINLFLILINFILNNNN